MLGTSLFRLDYFVCILIFNLYFFSAVAQKKKIDNDVYKNWETLGSYDISKDGKFVWYTIGSIDGPGRAVVVSSNGKWQMDIPDVCGVSFSSNGKYVIYCDSSGGCIMSLSDKKKRIIVRSSDIKVVSLDKNDWLVYKQDGWTVIEKLSTGQQRKYPGETKNWVDTKDGILVIQSRDTLKWVDLYEEKDRVILTGVNVEQISFSLGEKKITFGASRASSDEDRGIYYYNPLLDSAVMLVNNNHESLKDKYLILFDNVRFSEDSKRVFFLIQTKLLVGEKQTKPSKLTLWSYKDVFLASVQRKNPEACANERLNAYINIDNKNFVQLDSVNFELSGRIGERFVLGRPIFNKQESYWNAPSGEYTLISTETGERKKILPLSKMVNYLAISKSEKFVLWNSLEDDSYYFYNISSENTVKVNAADIFDESWGYNPSGNKPKLTVAGWLSDDSGLLLYDDYDIWLVDPLGIRKPICITGFNGRANKVIFRMLKNEEHLNEIHLNESVIVAAFEQETKRNGFFELTIGNSVPKKLNMEHCLYYFPSIFKGYMVPPLKAKNAKVFLLQRQSDIEAPNLVITSDFRSFLQISNIQPQIKYNWLTVDLIKWNISPNEERMGLLYKPEDFDPQKKYPVIFNYYEYRSNECYRFRDVDLSRANIDIPTYVSNGYIVFVPDIIKTLGQTGNNALEAVVSAANHLSKTYSWIDSTKMGIQGHSFGGYETNYIVTHSNIFAAACSAAGTTDLVSSFGQLDGEGNSRMLTYENGQGNLGSKPWDGVGTYISNSPIFFIQNVVTPMLMMHNRGDRAVPFEQALELYLALRREKKPVWLLEYEGQGHVLSDENDCALDFSIRTKEFFDYYLKNLDMPIWMSM